MTRIEHDKHLLALSASGIGLLVTLLTAVGVKSAESLVLYCVAILAFLICVLSVLAIFSRNADHLEKIITNNETDDPVLNILDKVAKSSFIFGILFTAILGVSVAINSYSKEIKMSGKKENLNIENIATESINNAARLRQNTTTLEKKSIDGAAKLRPSNQDDSSSSKKSE